MLSSQETPSEPQFAESDMTFESLLSQEEAFVGESSNMATMTAAVPLATPQSTRATGQGIRQKRQTSSDTNSNSLRTQAMASLKNSMESISSVASSLDNPHDKFDDFGEYVATTLRQMPTDFANRAMVELQYQMATLNSEAVRIS